MRSRSNFRLASLAILMAAALQAPPAAANVPAGAQVAWQAAAADADIERAFAQGRAQKKPVLTHGG